MTSPRMTSAEALALVQRASGMTAAETAAVLDLLLRGELPAEVAADVLVAWHQRGETADELAAVVRGLLARAVVLPNAGPCLDLCGTGGSGRARFNVSTTCAFILAAAGIPVAKHGNRGSRQPDGSFDLLDALDVHFQLPPDQLVRLLRESSACFLFARQMHPGVGALAPARKLAAPRVRRTIFNLAGPLANPLRPTCQLIGTADPGDAERIAGALALLRGAASRAIVVRGHPGIDEVSITGPTHCHIIAAPMSAAGAAQHHHCIIEAGHQHGLRRDALPGGLASENAVRFLRLIDSQEQGPLNDLVLVNAGMAIDLWHGRTFRADGPGVQSARELLASGAVRAAFDRHRALARALAQNAAPAITPSTAG